MTSRPHLRNGLELRQRVQGKVGSSAQRGRPLAFASAYGAYWTCTSRDAAHRSPCPMRFQIGRPRDAAVLRVVIGTLEIVERRRDHMREIDGAVGA